MTLLKKVTAPSLMILLTLQSAYARDMIDRQTAKLRSLDKITAKTTTFDVKVGSTVTFGDMFIKVQSCRTSPPLEEPESAAFLQIWEEENNESSWVFSGWMFASSPGLSHMDHPVYDVWVLECFGGGDEPAVVEEAVKTETEE